MDQGQQPRELKTAKQPYEKPTLRKHNEIVENTTNFSVGGPPVPGPPAGAQASPTVPAATVF